MASRGVGSDGQRLSLGLGANWRQFALLVAVNGFVGGMIGLERTILPGMAEEEFGIASKTAAVSFIGTFGLAKAVSNLLAGYLSQRHTRRRVLIAGWLFGLPVPFILMWAPSWGWVIGANLLLGVNQGLAWSMTINMKVDMVGPCRRGLALGFNETAGYLSVALAAFLSGVIAEHYGLRPEPFYLGIAFASLGLGLSVFLVRDTAAFVALEVDQHLGARLEAPPFRRTFAETTWRRPHLFGVTQAGLVKNLNDALAWGIFPLFFASKGLDLDRIANPGGNLSPGMGWAAVGYRLGQRHGRTQAPHRLWYDYPGYDHIPCGSDGFLQWVDCGGIAAGAGHGPGLSHPSGGRRRCRPSSGAGHGLGGVSLLA